MRKLTTLTLTILLSTIMAFGQTHTKQQLEDSVTKYQSLGRYYLNYTNETKNWMDCVDKYQAYQKQVDSIQTALYAIEQRKVLNKKYPEVKLK